MDVDFLLRLSYQVAELVGKELLSRLNVIGTSSVVREDLDNWAHAARNLLAEQINLVKEQDESRFLEVFRIRYRLEEHESFVHLVLLLR